ncbi:MAG TPA: hypothetical protein VNK46_16610 [Nitrospiraceae bacterium]|jgi:hypothetical protein|nr:hypothetical protein [Nitrospiraceae bacterium]
MPTKLTLLTAFWFATLPAWAGDRPNSWHFDADLVDTLVYELAGRALDALHDHLDGEGSITSDDQARERRGHFTFKLYPKGKSQSSKHITGETTFRFSTDPDHPSLHFEFKSSQDATGKPRRLPEDAS